MKWIQIFLLSWTLFFIQTCITTQNKTDCKTETTTTTIQPSFSIAEELNKRVHEPFDETKDLNIYFITNRKVQANLTPGCSDKYYTVSNEGQERFGLCLVNVPFLHEIGELPYNADNSGDPHKYFKFLDHKSYSEDDFFREVDGKGEEVILFIHGFNVKFEESVQRAAQIKYDMKFSGPIIVFSWPAGVSEGIFKSINLLDTYHSNQENAKSTIPMLTKVISKLKSQNKKLHVVVHSMGHQITLPSINNVMNKNQSKFIDQLILNAPDFDSQEFKNIADNLRGSAKRITVYCSPGDNALVVSSKVNQNKRVGSCERIYGVDMINVNPIDSPIFGVGGLGHGYYASRAILTDIYQVLLGLEVHKRLFIRKSIAGGTEDYILRK